MPTIRPLSAIRFGEKIGHDVSAVIAPPYDVLDEGPKQALLKRDPRNIVRIDLPFTPPKVAGPDAVYSQAAETLKAWLADGTLQRDRRPAIYPYQQSYGHAGKTYHRRGFFCLVKLSPFGQGEVIPHEKTYDGPIEDRLKLMRATGAQLSPVFGLFSDPDNEVNQLLYHDVARPQQEGTLDGVVNRLWSVIDAGVETKVIDLMRHRPIYIADGHHRYTTALHYQKEVRAKHGGSLPESHPANYCLFVLVPMQDHGLLIHPTHRLVGNLRGFDIAKLRRKLEPAFEIIETPIKPEQVADFSATLCGYGPHCFGLYDGASRKLFTLQLKNLDVLKPLEPDKSEAWRQLDVAILQRCLLDEAIAPLFAENGKPTLGYTAHAADVGPQVDGKKYQLGLLLQPTPLSALEALGKTGEVMPQKSTYFFPKLATGMVINPLE
jgi:uncharacterized protein (DUF1015 family)